MNGAGTAGGGATLGPHKTIEGFTTGLYGALGVTLALLHRERTGLGQSGRHGGAKVARTTG